METHVSATALQETPHETKTNEITISEALRRRAQSVINDRSIDSRWRNIIRNALGLNDPWLADFVRRADAGEMIIDMIDFSETPDTKEEDFSREKIEALAEIICGAGDNAAAALFVLMGTMQNSDEPAALANSVKHFAFTRCGELNVFGMVDAQIAVVQSELLADNTVVS
jgi:hypothetical protein